jgi:hypothetical protein
MGGQEISKADQARLATKLHAPETSNAIYLSGWQWVGVGILALVMVLFAPTLWQRIEKFDLEPDYRIPYDLSADYWLYDRYSRRAAAEYDTVLIGDSVVWGQYVTREQTLSHYLNKQAGGERYANLGLDGAHPAVLAGLLEHYAAGVSRKNVIIQWNPLWLTSARNDLQVEGDYPFNHPRLLPPFVSGIPAQPKEDYSTRLGIMVEQRLPFSSWTSHLQQAYFEQKDIPSWTLEHPYDHPLDNIKSGLPPSDNRLRHEPVSWIARGIKQQDFAWVDVETSIQWHWFRRAVEILERRGNHVFVLVGPFNEHMLTAANLPEYHKVKGAVEAWLRDNGVPCLAPAPLPSELYADASHPLAEGYALLADGLLKSHSAHGPKR